MKHKKYDRRVCSNAGNFKAPSINILQTNFREVGVTNNNRLPQYVFGFDEEDDTECFLKVDGCLNFGECSFKVLIHSSTQTRKDTFSSESLAK